MIESPLNIDLSMNQEHIGLLCLSIIFLINGIFNKKAVFSILGVVVLVYAGLQHIGHYSQSLLLHYGLDLMLVSIISGIAVIVRKKRYQLLFFPVALFSLAIGHFFLPSSVIEEKFHIEKNITQDKALDGSGEIFIQFRNATDAKKWINVNDDKYSIEYPAFNPKDKTFLLDEYAVIDLKDNHSIESAISKLENDPLIAYLEFNEELTLSLPEPARLLRQSESLHINDPDKDKQWMANKFDLDKFHKRMKEKSDSQTDNQTLIAILDTGVDALHEDLKENYISISERSDADERGHGTDCAGIAAAVTGNKIGIASWLPPQSQIKVTSVKVMTGFGVGTQRTIINGIIKAADNGADVISMSLGGPSSPSKERAYKEAFDYAINKGCTIVVAAGNSGKDARGYSPANTEGAITVTSVDSDLKKSDFGNDVSRLNMGIAAPGRDIYSTMPNNKYAKNSGTSMAAPFVSGLIGLMKHYNPQLNNEEIYDLLKSTARKKNGQLIIDPNRLFELILADI